MNRKIRLLIEGFFDDEIFNTDNDIKSNIEDLGRYYDYQVGDIYYLNKKPYAICCGEPKYFNDNIPRFCLLKKSKKDLKWRKSLELVKELQCFNHKSFILKYFNDFQHIDEDGYKNTQIIKNNYVLNEFPAFKYCIKLGKNVYLPAIDELQMLYLNKDKLKDVIDLGISYYSSSQNSSMDACCINTYYGLVGIYIKDLNFRVRPFFHLN